MKYNNVKMTIFSWDTAGKEKKGLVDMNCPHCNALLGVLACRYVCDILRTGFFGPSFAMLCPKCRRKIFIPETVAGHPPEKG